MNTISDISSVVWTEKSFDSESYINTDSLATDNQIKEKLLTLNSVQRLSTKQNRIIIFTTIGILSFIIIVLLATIIAIRKSNDNPIDQPNISTNNINDHTKSTSGTIGTVYDVGGGGISDGSPCSSYTVIDDPSRSVNQPGIGGACDSGSLFNTSIGGRWIRFMGKGGTIIPSFSPGWQHCGAYLAGWCNMTLPSTTNTLANGNVCFETLMHICGFHISVTVVNCESFYVYFLTAIDVCNARYCTI